MNNTNIRLSIELVPKPCWYSNVRSNITATAWNKLRKESYRKADYRCEICGRQGQLECHEIWEYDDSEHIQTLQGLISLCSMCHEVKHIGLANLRGRLENAKRHLADVNGWNNEQANQYLERVWTVWKERNTHEWKLNLSWLEK